MNEDVGNTFYFETKQIVSRELDSVEKTSGELFDILAKSYSSKVPKAELCAQVKDIVDRLVTQDGKLQVALTQACQQLERHNDILKVKEEIRRTDEEIAAFHSQLKETESLLATSLHQAKKKLRSAEEAMSSSISCEELIKFAFRISSGNSVEAPAGWIQGDPRRPYPLDIEMRCGELGRLTQDGPQRPEETKKPEEETKEPTQVLSTNVWQAPGGQTVEKEVENTTTAAATAVVDEVEIMSTSSDSSSSEDSN